MNKTLLLLGLPAALVSGLLTTGATAAGTASFTDGSGDCRDISAGPGTYQRLVQSISQPAAEVPGYYKPYSVTLQDRGVVEVTVQLQTPSCEDVAYTLNVYQREQVPGAPGTYRPGALIGTASVKGDGQPSLVLRAVTEAVDVTADNRQLVSYFQVVTSDRRGTYDFAPDVAGTDGSSMTAKADGTGGGGATSSFK